MSEATSKSDPNIRSAEFIFNLAAFNWFRFLENLRCPFTGPPFWANPNWFITLTCRPSRCAAIPKIKPMVTTPVPPTPDIKISYGFKSSILAILGSGVNSK